MAKVNWKRWAKRLGITLSILFVLYVVIGFWGVPLLLRHVGLAKLNEQVAGNGEVEAFRFNPFTWELKIEQLSGFTPDGEEVLSFGEFRINVQPTSVFGDEMAVLEITLDQPYLNLVIDENGKPNIADALAKLQEQVDEAEKAAAESNEPFVIPPLRVDKLHVVNAGFRVEINAFAEPFVREMKDVSFTMDNVRTSSEHDNPYQFQLATGQGETVNVNGELRLDPLSSWGKVNIDQLQLQDFLVFAGDQVGFGMEGGALDFAIDYAFVPLGQNPRLQMSEGHILLTDMALTEKGQDDPFQKIGRLELTGLGIDILNSAISLDNFTLEDSMLRVVRGKDGVLNLIRYISPPERQAEIAQAASEEAAAEKAAREIRLGVVSDDQDLGVALTSAWDQIQDLVELKWDLSVQEVALSGLALTWRDEFLAKPAELRWSDISLTSSELNNGDAPFPYDLGLTMNESGALKLNGQFTATPASTSFEVDVTDLPLAPISPYIEASAPVALQSGALSASGQAEIVFPDEGLPELSAKINGGLSNFALQWENGDPLLAWQKVSVSGVDATTRPMSLVVSNLSVEAPEVHLERQADGSPRLPLPENKESGQPSNQPEKTAPPSPPSTAEDFSLQVDELQVSNGSIYVRDQSVSPETSFALKQFQFTAAPLSYPEIQPTTFSLGYGFSDGPSGTIKVEGALDPLQPFANTEFKVNTSGVTLAPFAAYAVPIIGQPPTQGQLNANLGYTITNGKITGQNKMKIKTVRFGKRPADSDAPSIPLEMGVAILEDREGYMNIDIPVMGDVNDPKFSIDSMIAYAIGNVLEKVATAPFDFVLGGVASLLPGEDGDRYVPFEPGSSQLSNDMQTAIPEITAKLLERPAMVTTLVPSVAPDADTEALRAQKFDAMLQAKMTENNDDAESATASLYEALPQPEGAPSSDLTMEQQQKAIRDSIEITNEDLAALAQARTQAVYDAIIAAGLPEANVVVSTESPYTQEGARVLFGAESDLSSEPSADANS